MALVLGQLGEVLAGVRHQQRGFPRPQHARFRTTTLGAGR
jgi:hypothetical protein